MQPHFSTPLHNRLSSSVECQQSVSAPIIGLFSIGSPFTVIGGITLIIINTVKRMLFRRSFTHICKKVFKRGLPSFTYGNAAPSIVFIANILRIRTSGPHTYPDLVFLCFGFAMSDAMNIAKASTTPNGAPYQIGCTHSDIIAAYALAQPEVASIFVGQQSQYMNIVTLHAGYIFKSVIQRQREKSNFRNVNINNSHRGFTSFVKFQLVRLGKDVSAFCRAISILPLNPYLQNRLALNA